MNKKIRLIQIKIQLEAKASSDLCNNIAMMARRICTKYVDPEGLPSFTACRLIALDKNPGVRPIGSADIGIVSVSRMEGNATDAFHRETDDARTKIRTESQVTTIIDTAINPVNLTPISTLIQRKHTSGTSIITMGSPLGVRDLIDYGD